MIDKIKEAVHKCLQVRSTITYGYALDLPSDGVVGIMYGKYPIIYEKIQGFNGDIWTLIDLIGNDVYQIFKNVEITALYIVKIFKVGDLL